jgi:glutathione S-transferase
MDDTYKLYYFPENGRAALIRAILTYVSAKLEDIKITKEEWTTLKNTGIFVSGHLPILEINNENTLDQTIAIELYLAKKYDLLGNNIEDDYKIHNLLCSREDILKAFFSLVYFPGDNECERDEVVANIKKNIIPLYFKKWELMVAKKAGKYLLGDKVTLADLFIAVNVENILRNKTGKEYEFESIQVDFPSLVSYVTRLKHNELASFFKNYFNYDAKF